MANVLNGLETLPKISIVIIIIIIIHKFHRDASLETKLQGR